MRPAGSAATAATGLRSGPATATATGSGCPRLTGGAVRLKDPILDYRSNDLTAIDRGTGVKRARWLRAARALYRLCPSAATQTPDSPECTCGGNLRRERPGKHGPVTF
jgi:hypothetical protein